MDQNVCRICLARNIRMYSIANTGFQYMYEKLTDHLLTQSGRSQLVCYVCLAQLRNCHQLMIKCHQTEKMLTQIVDGKQPNWDNIEKMASRKKLSVVKIDELDEYYEEVKTESTCNSDCNYIDPNNHAEVQQDQSLEEDPLEGRSEINQRDQSKINDRFIRIILNFESDISAKQEMSNLKGTKVDGNKGKTNDNARKQIAKNILIEHKVESDMDNKNNSAEYINNSQIKKKFTCKYCSNGFAQKSQLDYHLRIHTGEKPYKCDRCEKTFAQRTQLNNHLRIHTDQKPFKCEQCSKAFRQLTQLNNHKRTHTGEKPYPCTLCSKKFVQKTHLNNHMRKHTGEKPFECSICGVRFTQRANLDFHSRRYHDV